MAVAACCRLVFRRLGAVALVIDESTRDIVVFAEREVCKALAPCEGEAAVGCHRHGLFVAVAVRALVTVASEAAVIDERVGVRCLILSVGGAPSCTLSVVVGCPDSRTEDIQALVVGDEIG